ncbi:MULTISPECIES: hypothetical protein [Luteimonas]|uniref:hypothetical protein n=1 Tax=Luteimonas TaxID=83614 RepID=UPI00117CDD32|nr:MULTISPECIES: hypothetical protein [Luteimonas]
MRDEDRQFLNGQMGAFVRAGISRSAHSGNTIYHYSVEVDDLKNSTGRQRLPTGFIDECVDFFEKRGASAHYDESSDSLNVRVDMDVVRLNAREAEALTEAQDLFRMSVG